MSIAIHPLRYNLRVHTRLHLRRRPRISTGRSVMVLASTVRYATLLIVRGDLLLRGLWLLFPPLQTTLLPTRKDAIATVRLSVWTRYQFWGCVIVRCLLLPRLVFG